MQLREKNEKRRSLWWKIIMGASSAIILFVLGCFVVNFIQGNPLKGEWVSEKKNYDLVIDDEKITVKGNFDGQDMEFKLNYSLNKKQKLITIKGGVEEYGYVASAWTTEETNEAAGAASVTFSYSLGRKTLTLIDREYGVEFVFTRK